MYLGIEQHTGLIYEGTGSMCAATVPVPLQTPESVP